MSCSESILVQLGEGIDAGKFASEVLSTAFKNAKPSLHTDSNDWYKFMKSEPKSDGMASDEDESNNGNAIDEKVSEVQVASGIVRCLNWHLGHVVTSETLNDATSSEKENEFFEIAGIIGQAAASLQQSIDGRVRSSGRSQAKSFKDLKEGLIELNVLCNTHDALHGCKTELFETIQTSETFEESVSVESVPTSVEALVKVMQKQQEQLQSMSQMINETRGALSVYERGNAGNTNRDVSFSGVFSPIKASNGRGKEATTSTDRNDSRISTSTNVEDIDHHFWRDLVKTTFDYINTHKITYGGGNFLKWIEYIDNIQSASEGAFNCPIIDLASMESVQITGREDKLLTLILKRTVGKIIMQSVEHIRSGIGRLRRLHELYGQSSAAHKAELMGKFYGLLYHPTKMCVYEHLNHCMKLTQDARRLGNTITVNDFQGVVLKSFKSLKDYALLKDFFNRWWVNLGGKQDEQTIASICNEFQNIIRNRLDMSLTTRLSSVYNLENGNSEKPVKNGEDTKGKGAQKKHKGKDKRKEKGSQKRHPTYKVSQEGYNAAVSFHEYHQNNRKMMGLTVYDKAHSKMPCHVEGCKGFGHYSKDCTLLKKFRTPPSGIAESPGSVNVVADAQERDGLISLSTIAEYESPQGSVNMVSNIVPRTYADVVAGIPAVSNIENVDLKDLGVYEHSDVVTVYNVEENDVSTDKGWLVDSGAAVHLTNVFGDLVKDVVEVDVEFGTADGSAHKLSATHRGSVLVIDDKDKQVVIPDVYYSGHVGRRLLSRGLLEEQLHLVETPTVVDSRVVSRCLRSRDHVISLTADSTQRGWIVKAGVPGIVAPLGPPSLPSVKVPLWHYRLAHAGSSALERTQAAVHGMDLNAQPQQPCKGCLASVRAHAHVRQPLHAKAQHVGGRIGYDIVGPITPTGLGGIGYFSIGRDEFSGYTTVGFMVTKDVFANDLDGLLQRYRNSPNVPKDALLRLRVDADPMYSSHHFKTKVLHKHNVHLEMAAPGSHASNGLAESTIGLVCSRARSVLAQAELPQRVWPYIVMAVVHLINLIVPTGKHVTPYEAFYGVRPDLRQLVILGSPCKWRVINRDNTGKSKKFMSRCRTGRVVGYACETSSFAYYVVPDPDPAWGGDGEYNSVVIRTDVFVDERAFFHRYVQNRQSLPLEAVPWDCRTKEYDFSSERSAAHQVNRFGQDQMMGNDPVFHDPDDVELIQDNQVVSHPDIDPSPATHTSLASREVTTPSDTLASSVGRRRSSRIASRKARGVMMASEAVYFMMVLGSTAMFSNLIIPTSHMHAKSLHNYQSIWKKAEEEEMQSLNRLGVFIPVNKVPDGHKLVTTRWVYDARIKKGGKAKIKARLVARCV